jgi:phage head maturation protease
VNDDDDGCDVLPLGAYTGREADDTPCAPIGVDREAGAEDGLTRFVASTSREDRHGTVIDQSSWRLANFRRNPVILLNHNRDAMPVGRAETTKIADHGTPTARLELAVRWDAEDPAGALVAGKFARGFMTSGSVSFRPGKATDRAKLPEDHPAFRKPREDDSPWWPSLFYERSELLEFSAVTVPSNVDAQAIRSWGARQLAEIRTDAATVEDPDERIRRIATEIVDARGLDLVMRALRTGSIELRAVLADLVFGRKAPVEPPSNRQFSDWWNQEKP